VVATPHVAFNTPEAGAAMVDLAILNVERYYAGDPINVVAGPARSG
jgi:phosphoglycerate dehydrogenase-like enzyme